MASNNTVASHDQNASNQPGGSTEFQLKKYLLLLATLVATVTYVAGLNLPGGVWQDTQDGHLAGDPILPDTHNHLYLAFYYCNATAFAASLVVCLLLLVLDVGSAYCAAVLRVIMVLDLLGLMGAYASGSCRDGFTTIYSLVVMSSVFTYIVLAFFAYVISMLHKKQDEDPEKHHKDSDEQRKLDEDTANRRHKDNEEHKREVLMLLATFAVTITYVAGLNPPGGFWANTQGGHRVSDPVLQDHNSSRYRAFFVCNTTAFVASLLIIMLLLDKKLKLSSAVSVRFVALYGSIIIVLFGLVGAYAAGSCREADNTAYVVCLIGAVLAYIFLQVTITKAIHSDRKDGLCCGVLAKIYDTASEWLQKIRKFFAGSESHTKPDLPGSKDTKHNKALEKAYNLVMLLATLVASITYQAGLDPPGGLWPDDRDGHKGGDPVLLTTHPARYKVFFYSNSAAFVASLVVIMMVQSRFLLKRHTLEAAMLLDLFGLIGAYAAGDKDLREREYLMLIGVLAASVTYQTGLKPPGGLWQDNGSGRSAGDSILHDIDKRRYHAFFYSNSTSFMASIVVIVLLLQRMLHDHMLPLWPMHTAIFLDMLGLLGAYAAGSTREWETSRNVIALVVPVLAYIAAYAAVSFFRKKGRCHKGNSASTTPQ